MPCRHCERNRTLAGRGLCFPCHAQPGIRNRYPCLRAASYRTDVDFNGPAALVELPRLPARLGPTLLGQFVAALPARPDLLLDGFKRPLCAPQLSGTALAQRLVQATGTLGAPLRHAEGLAPPPHRVRAHAEPKLDGFGGFRLDRSDKLFG